MNKKRSYLQVEKFAPQILQYHEEGDSYAEISQKLDLPNSVIVKNFIARYRRKQRVGFPIRSKGRPRIRPESLEEEVKRLRKEVELLKLFHQEVERSVGHKFYFPS